MTKAKGIFSTLGSALDGAREELDQIRDRIADLKRHRAEIEAMPDDAATIQSRLDAAIAAAAAERPLHFSGLSRLDASDVGLPGFFVRAVTNNPFGVLAALFPEALKAAMLESIPGDGLPPDERASLTAKVEQNLFVAEVAEERACRELERALAVDVPRRTDALPQLLLAPDAELPGAVS